MGYKLLGFLIWQGAKFYIRRRVDPTKAKVALAGLTATVVAGAVLAGRQQATGDS
ncbi:MAG TPA: hypothetical protein VGL51_00775 [Solirubrobacteraceae bacterium]|jgi:hypothetical protein